MNSEHRRIADARIITITIKIDYKRLREFTFHNDTFITSGVLIVLEMITGWYEVIKATRKGK